MLFKASVRFSMAAGTIGGTLSRRFGLAALAIRLRLAQASATFADLSQVALPNWLSVPIFCTRGATRGAALLYSGLLRLIRP